MHIIVLCIMYNICIYISYIFYLKNIVIQTFGKINSMKKNIFDNYNLTNLYTSTYI